MFKSMKNIIITGMLGLLLSASSVSAQTVSIELKKIADEWANIVFINDKSVRKTQLKSLNQRAQQLLSAAPDDENVLTWKGIVSSTYAAEVGGLKALKIVKQAKKNFERAMKLDPDALEGGARTSLGALYYQVPGWPIGFGNKKKAERLLSESAEKFPDNINTLYFLGSFLQDQKRYSDALEIMLKAEKIEPQKNALVAGRGRLDQIKTAIAELKRKI